MVKSYRELIVWQKAMELATEVYGLVKLLPREETYALGDQMRRAAVSIPSNIAEGYGRSSKKDYANFLTMARGSAYEVETQILLCNRINLLSTSQVAPALQILTEITRMVNAMLAKLAPHPTPSTLEPKT